MTSTETRDREYQKFRDWARGASVPVMLEHVAQMMRSDRSFFVYDTVMHESLRQVAKAGGWGEVIRLIGDVQGERDSKVA